MFQNRELHTFSTYMWTYFNGISCNLLLLFSERQSKMSQNRPYSPHFMVSFPVSSPNVSPQYHRLVDQGSTYPRLSFRILMILRLTQDYLSRWYYYISIKLCLYFINKMYLGNYICTYECTAKPLTSAPIVILG